MISLRQIRLLSQAVTEAAQWRGNLVGAAPDWAIEEFDDKIRLMRAAVHAAMMDRIELKSLKLAVEYKA